MRGTAAPQGRGIVNSDEPSSTWLLFRVRSRLVGLPLACVVEVLRPLPVDTLPGTPPWVVGMSLLRGAATPVVDAAALLGGPLGPRERLISLKLAERRVGLLVDQVVGLRELPADLLKDLPLLLQEAGQETVAALGILDEELLLVLGSAQLVQAHGDLAEGRCQ